MKKLLLLLAALIIFSMPCTAADDIGSVFEPFMAENGLNEDNFALGWMDLATGETWYFGQESFMVAGSMYKLPLVMVITDMISEGEIQRDELVGGYQIDVAASLAIVESNNETAALLTRAVDANYTEYRKEIARYSGYSEAELPEEYYNNNAMSPRFVLNTLKYLYDNAENYPKLIEDMKKAHPGRYFDKGNEELDIAHKYGFYEGSINDCAIVHSERPFALVAFTRDVYDGESLLSRLCTLAAEYEFTLAETVPPAENTPAAVPSVPMETVQPAHVDADSVVPFALIAAVVLIFGVIIFKKREK